MRLVDLARQLNVDASKLLVMSRELGLEVAEPDHPLTKADEWALRKALVTRRACDSGVSEARTSLQGWDRPAWRRPQSTVRPNRRRPTSEPSDMVKVFLEHEEEAWPSYDAPPRHVLVEKAEVRAREWAEHLFTPSDVKKWLKVHPGLAANVAAALRDAGLSPEQSSVKVRTQRGFVHRLPIAVRVSLEELTAAEAADELRASGQQS